MDLETIKTLIDFVGRSNVTQLTVTDRDTTIRIFRTQHHDNTSVDASAPVARGALQKSDAGSVNITAPIFGVLHRSPSPGEPPFVKVGDVVTEGQTLFIIEAMKVFNRISAPCAGRVVKLTDVDGTEVETGDALAEITP